MFSIIKKIPNKFVSKLDQLDDLIVIEMIRKHFNSILNHKFDYLVEVIDNRVVSIPLFDKKIYISYVVHIGEGKPTDAVIPLVYDEYQDILSDKTSRIREVRINNLLS